MNRIIRVVAAALTLAAALPATAQEAAPARVGVGIGIPASEFLTPGDRGQVGPQIYVPINVLPNIRVEPQFGFLTFHDDDTQEEQSLKSIGTGVFWVMPLGGNADFYIGPRLVLSFARAKESIGGGFFNEFKATDLYLAAALGGEVALHPRLSIGAEGQIGYTSYGDLETTAGDTGAVTETPGASSWSTQGILFVRVYLF